MFMRKKKPHAELKLYLAGPEVFLPDAPARAKVQRDLCRRYGFIPLHPMDNNLDLGRRGMKVAMRIQRGDVRQVIACDIVVANCNPFRGICMDDGTAYELGYGNALGKPSYGYIQEDIPLSMRTRRDYPCTKRRRRHKSIVVDREGYEVTDDFGTRINLMMECGMLGRGGRLVVGDFEDCLQAIRDDIEHGKLVL